MSSILRFKDFAHRFVNFITFIDLSIRKKFLLFGVGVLFWFVAMFAVLYGGMNHLEDKSHLIVDKVVPQERSAEKVVRNLQAVLIDAMIISMTNDHSQVMSRVSAATTRFGEIGESLRNLSTIRREYSAINRTLLKGFSTEAVAADEDGERVISDLNASASLAAKQFRDFSDSKFILLAGEDNSSAVREKLDDLRKTIDRTILLSSQHAVRIGALYQENMDSIESTIHYAIISGSLVLFIAILLLAVFTYMISKSITIPVNSIINQIHALNMGDIDLSKRVVVASNDEIGVLSEEFNNLMESIHGMNTYKKVIEEDENLDDVYSRLGNALANRHDISRYMIYEVSNSQNKMKPVYPLPESGTEIGCNQEALDNCDLCKAKKTGHEISSFVYPRICKQFDMTTGSNEHFCMPMMIGGTTGGVVQLRFDTPLSDAELREVEQKIYRAQQYVRESVSVIEAKRLMGSLRDSALKDPLTGLNNRRFLQEYTEKLVAGALRRGKHIGLIMCDLDYFKQVNDVHGHQAGDVVLKEVSLVIRKSVREADIVIRFGGEEFLVVILDIAENDAMLVAEKIRTNMEKARIRLPQGVMITKTISLGISEFPSDAESFWQAIKYADVALYKAKENGRNKAIRFSKDMWGDRQF